MRQFSAMSWLRSLPGLERELKGEVPDDFWAEDVAEDGTRVGVISCPCGETPKVPDNGLRACEGEGCGRAFVMLGDRVWVARYDPED